MKQLLKTMQVFLPHYLTFDMNLKAHEEWDLKFLFGLWTYHIQFYDFKYKEPTLDFVDVKVVMDEYF